MLQTIEFDPAQLKNPDGSFCDGGVEIRIKGFKTNPCCPDDGQVWIDTYEGRTRVHIWNGDTEDPVTIDLHPVQISTPRLCSR